MSTTASPTSTLVPTGTWAVDPDHSQVDFRVRHMGIATVRGEFDAFRGTLVVGDGPADVTAEAVIEAASISTRNDDRDAHLRSADFLDAENHPSITFRSREVRATGADAFDIVGDLTMAGTTQSVTLHAEVSGLDTDPWGGERAGLSLSGSLSRKDFGMTFNQVLGSGNVLVADTVKIAIDLSLVRQAA